MLSAGKCRNGISCTINIYDNEKIKCYYIYVNEALLTSEILLTCLKTIYDKPILSMTPLKLDSNKAIGFVKVLYQLLLQNKITTIDIKSSILKHHEICEEVAAVQLDKLKDEFPQIAASIRLIVLYNELIVLIKTRELTFQQYLSEKNRCYKTKH